MGKDTTPPSSSCSSTSGASLRWAILRQAFRSSSSLPDLPSQRKIKCISRKAIHGFNLIPCHVLNGQAQEDLGPLMKIKNVDGTRDAYVCYQLPIGRTPRLVLIQRSENCVDLKDFEICNANQIDNTGVVCLWPSEIVLTYFCLSHADMFRSKRILELGSGYGLAGLAIAASTDAFEVILSDGNPQVLDYIQHCINVNSDCFGDTQVQSMTLHWDQEQDPSILNTFDIIIASDCTFFKESHVGLALALKSLLKHSENSEAIFLGPRRGNSLDLFLEKLTETDLHFDLVENYDSKVWDLHQRFLTGDDPSWPNYDKDHCYPILVRITHNCKEKVEEREVADISRK